MFNLVMVRLSQCQKNPAGRVTRREGYCSIREPYRQEIVVFSTQDLLMMNEVRGGFRWTRNIIELKHLSFFENIC